MRIEAGDCYAAANGMIVTAREDGSIPLNARVVAKFSDVVDEDAFDRLINSAAEVKRLQRAIGDVLIGGNHLALLIGADHPPYTATPDEALAFYGKIDLDRFEIWCCWRSIMRARDALEAAH